MIVPTITAVRSSREGSFIRRITLASDMGGLLILDIKSLFNIILLNLHFVLLVRNRYSWKQKSNNPRIVNTQSIQLVILYPHHAGITPSHQCDNFSYYIARFQPYCSYLHQQSQVHILRFRFGTSDLTVPLMVDIDTLKLMQTCFLITVLQLFHLDAYETDWYRYHQKQLYVQIPTIVRNRKNRQM